jgi:hypothetical protein
MTDPHSSRRFERWLRERKRMLGREDGALVVVVRDIVPDWIQCCLLHDSRRYKQGRGTSVRPDVPSWIAERGVTALPTVC